MRIKFSQENMKAFAEIDAPIKQKLAVISDRINQQLFKENKEMKEAIRLNKYDSSLANWNDANEKESGHKKRVLIFTKGGKMQIGAYNHVHEAWFVSGFKISKFEVLYWQPLPPKPINPFDTIKS